MADAMNVYKKLVRSKSGLRIVTNCDSHRSPFELCEPPWIPDTQCITCMKCCAKFDFITRRHHCRRCGKCFCTHCSSYKVPLPRMCFVDPVRHCEACAETTKKENEFYDRHLKMLLNGGNFLICDSNSEEIDPPTMFCKLSLDHRYLLFDGGQTPPRDPLDINRVISITSCSDEDYQGNVLPNSLLIKYKTQNGQVQDLKLVASNIPNKKQSLLWIQSMQKAGRLLGETR